jgi:hypothetical protein
MFAASRYNASGFAVILQPPRVIRESSRVQQRIRNSAQKDRLGPGGSYASQQRFYPD